MKSRQTNNFKEDYTKKMQVISISSVIMASAIMGLAFDLTKNAYAVTSCSGGPNGHCYAQHIFSPNFNVNGMQSTEKVLYTSLTAGWLENSNWVFLTDGHFVELGWHQNTGSNPYFLCGKDGAVQETWGSPSDNTYYVFSAEDLAVTDNKYKMTANGHTCNILTGTAYAYKLEVGYEFTRSDGITLRTNDYTGIQYAKAPSTWQLWNSADGAHTKYLYPNDGTYFVQYCGTGNQNYYHSQHGQGTPPTC